MKQASNNYRSAFIAVTSLFFMWGFITVMVDALIPRLKEVFELEYWQAALVQLAWFMAYGLVSIPAGVLLSRSSYKRGIVVGLTLAGAGCLLFYPAAELRIFGVFLTALFVLASGITVLQVAANPYIAVLGSNEGAASRLNLAQAFNSLGTTIAPVIAASYLLSDKILTSDEVGALDLGARELYYTLEANAVEGPFLAVASAFFILALILGLTKLPRIIGGDHMSLASLGKALSNKTLLFGALGIFVYVGAEVAIGSFLTNYFLDLQLDEKIVANDTLKALVNTLSSTFSGKSINELDSKGIVASFVLFYWGMAMIGRFVGAGLTRKFPPSAILSVFGIGAIVLTCISITSSGYLAMATILAVGFFNSVMFPTIFTMGLEDLGEHKPEGSGILCTAIVGGAVIPPLVGSLRDSFGSFSQAFILPILCYVVIIAFAIYFRKRRIHA